VKRKSVGCKMLLLDQDIWRLKKQNKNRQNLTNLAVFPKVNNRRRPKTLQKALIFMHFKSRPKYLETTKNWAHEKTVENHPKSSQEHSKKTYKIP
jgi:hypothetical protein